MNILGINYIKFHISLPVVLHSLHWNECCMLNACILIQIHFMLCELRRGLWSKRTKCIIIAILIATKQLFQQNLKEFRRIMLLLQFLYESHNTAVSTGVCHLSHSPSTAAAQAQGHHSNPRIMEEVVPAQLSGLILSVSPSHWGEQAA